MSGYPLEAILIVDNNSLVCLCDYYRDRHKQLPFNEMIEKMCEDIAADLNTLKSFAHDGEIFTTSLVHDEFMPENGELRTMRGFSIGESNRLKEHAKGQVKSVKIHPGLIEFLRNLEDNPKNKKYGDKLSRLSDADLSLFVLALELSQKHQARTYVLTDEEDLRNYISLIRNRPGIKAIYPQSHLVESLHSLIYMDSAHRECAFQSLYIYQRLSHYSKEQARRSLVQGTTKGEMIGQTLEALYQAINASSIIKQQKIGAAQA